MSEILHFQVDPSSGVPAYRQLMDQIRYYMASGTLRPGDKLPSIRALAKRLRLNPTTITKAYGELRHGGWLRLEQGRGVFVAEGAKAMTRANAEKELRRLATALAAAARQLGTCGDDAVALLREEMDRLGAGEPVDGAGDGDDAGGGTV